MDGLTVFLIVFFSMFPDLDIFYGGMNKGLENLDENFQHHYFSRAHYPLLYVPFIVLFVVSFILDFFPLYFLIPVIGVYLGHFLFDTIACGDGIMWGKNPFKKEKYARFINIYCKKTDGYHGKYWYARYRKTLIGRFGNILVILCVVLIQTFQILVNVEEYPHLNSSYFYLSSTVYLLLTFSLGVEKLPDKFFNEPPNGRYDDYRVDPNYINGLNEKNRQKHLIKYSKLFKD